MGSVPYSRYILYPVPWYSFLIVLGAAVAIVLAVREEKRLQLKKDTVVDLALWVIPVGIIGARLYYVAFSWDQFRDDPLSVFRIWEGGIAIYGALIAGFFALVLFCRKRRLPLLLLCDLLAPGLAFAQGLGRWGNYFNMEAYGLMVTNPSLCFFPLAVQIPYGSDFRWHLATFFYESVWDLSVFIFLMSFRRKEFRRTGDLFLWYVFLYASGRLVVEELRLDSLYSSSVRVSQLLSVILIICLLFHFVLRGKKHHRHFPASVMILLSFAAFSSVLICLLVFHFPFLSAVPLKCRFFFLCAYSVLMIVSMFAMYTAVLKEKNHADN